MKKHNFIKGGIVLGIIALFIGGSLGTMTERSVIDPNNSFVDLTGAPGIVTCPAGDITPYQYIKITCKDPFNQPMAGLSASCFSFNLANIDAQWYGTLSCTFAAFDSQTNANGEIRFTIKGDTSIKGNITITVAVNGIQINDLTTLQCKTPDYNLDGSVSLGDFTVFGQDYTTTRWRSDFSFDGQVSLGDFTTFGQHYTHT